MGPPLIAGGHVLTLIQAAVAVLIMISAVHLYRLRAWAARRSLEAVSWLGLVMTGG